MRRTPDKEERQALNLWMEGDTYREVHSKSGVAPATVSRIVSEARRRNPDLDDLRSLNLELKKAASNVEEAVEGAKLVERLKAIGIDLDRLKSFVDTASQISSDHGVGPASLVSVAFSLIELKTKTGKEYEQLIKDYEEKMAQLQELNLKAEKLQEEIRKAGGEKKLAEWRASLLDMGIDPDHLAALIKQKGSLGEQIRKLAGDVKKQEERFSSLKNEISYLEARKGMLLAQDSRISLIWEVLKSGQTSLACTSCRQPISIRLDRKEAYAQAIRNGVLFQITCQICGYPNQFDPRDVPTSLGWQFLPP